VPGSRIAALGHYQPARVLTNDELATMVETSDEWIRRRTGVATRRIADAESVADMATEAAAKALAAAGLAAAEVDLVTVATCSAIDRIPSTAARVAANLGIPSPAVYDVNNACAGFCTALATADHAVRAEAARHALVVGAEKMSDVTDWSDRSTCILLGDGAGAAVVSACESPRIGPVVWGSDPAQAGSVRLLGDWHPRFAQDGQAVFRWATTEVPALARRACERAGVAPAELAGIVTHQANLRIIEAVVRHLGLPESVVVARDVVGSGNTSAASVPLALSKLAESRAIPSGGPVLLIGFGGGLSWAGQVVACP
jgi:3-oxoacyl-[acyl-carrier-protein] synthase III